MQQIETPEIRADRRPIALGPREMIAMMASMMALNALAIDAMLPAFPAIRDALNIPNANDTQFLISSYFLAVGIGSLVYGPLADRFGRRPVLLSCLSFYLIFALGCAFSPSFEFLLAMRFAQGLAAAALGVLVVSVIRDLFDGDAMARLMSMIFIVFMAVPVLAPTIGQLILYVAEWRFIFIFMAVMAAIVFGWAYLRLPETLHPENVRLLDLVTITQSWKMVIFNRIGLGYIVASGVVMGALFGFLNSSQQIFDKVFNAADIFPYAFAAVAGAMAISNFFNSRIVERIGARRVSHSALVMFIILSLGQILAGQIPDEPMLIFLVLIALNMSMVGFTGANFGSIAMQPFGEVAGAASSFQAFVRTILGAVIGAVVGQFFNGTTLPMSQGFLVCGVIALIAVLFAEKGKLFQRPGTTKSTSSPR